MLCLFEIQVLPFLRNNSLTLGFTGNQHCVTWSHGLWRHDEEYTYLQFIMFGLCSGKWLKTLLKFLYIIYKVPTEPTTQDVVN